MMFRIPRRTPNRRADSNSPVASGPYVAAGPWALLAVLLLGGVFLVNTGCRSGSSDDPAGGGGTTTAGDGGSGSDTAGDDGTSKKFELGDLIEPFDPPALEELEKSVEWEEGAVVDASERLREYWSQIPQPATRAEALKLTNDSPKTNEVIRESLGRAAMEESDVDYDAEWLRHIGADVKSTNPIMMSSTAEFYVADMTGAGLIGFDWTMEPFASADYVASWHRSKDGLYDKVVLRDDLVWSDGTPITAHDVEFSFRLIMTEAVPVPAVRSGTDQLKYVKAYDDQTVMFFHKEPLATNVWNISFPFIPKHIYEKSVAEDPTLEKSEYHVKMDQNPVTGGPYRIVSRERNQQIVFERREDYYMKDGEQVRAKPHFKTVRMKVIQDPSTALLALKKGEIEELELTPEQWQTQTNDSDFYARNTKAYGVEWVYFYFGWNCKTPYFEDARVRQAMSYAFDHEEMIERHRFGLDQPAQGIFHPESKWFPKDAAPIWKQDLKKAQELLAAAGWEDHDGDGILDKEVKGKLYPFEFTILVSQRQDRIDLCNLLRENLDAIGIICNVKPTEFTVLQDYSRKHKFHAIMAGWGTGTDPDTSENLWTTKAIDAGRNYVQYSNPEIDELFKQGKTELDPEKRLEIYGKIHKVLYEDQPYTWLYFRNSYYAFNKKLGGYKFSPRGPYSYGPGQMSLFKASMK